MAEEQPKKKNNVLLTVFIVAAIITGASVLSVATLAIFNPAPDNKKVYTASYLANEVVKKMNYENLSEIPPSDIANYYEIPADVVTDSAMFVSTRSDSYTEIACFKLENEDDEDKLTEIIGGYIDAKKKSYQNLSEKAYSVVSASKTGVHYPYVFVAISTDSDAAISTFESLVTAAEQTSA